VDPPSGSFTDAERMALDYLIDEIRWTRNAARILLGLALGLGLGGYVTVSQPTAGNAAYVSLMLAVVSGLLFLVYFWRINPLKSLTQQMIAARLTGEFRSKFDEAVQAAKLL
jgi:hypothetical protein